MSWSDASQQALEELRSKNLLRVQRPIVPLLSASEALIPPRDLEAWAQGQPAQPNHLTVSTWQLSNLPEHSHPPSTVSSPACQSPPAPSSDLQPLRLFSLNDYLGLAAHQEVCQAAAQAALQRGMGYRSSAIVGGTTVLHRTLEEELSQLKGTEDCLLFPTGFAANMGVVTSLAGIGSGPVAILSDELNHASIIDGARLALRSGAASGKVTLHIYRHNDLTHLEQLLQGLAPGTLALVVTDSLFSMDGDFADLRGLARLRQRYGFLLVVDEAHATLVCGDQGAGAAEAMGVAEQVDVHVGTLSKAFGALGGFVATSKAIKELLVNKGRGYVYSTALPVPVVEAARAALRVSKRETWRRSHVWSLVHRLGQALGIPALSPVIPLVVGTEQEALRLGSLMLRHSMHVPVIRPPTVPQGTCRLRVSLSAAHTVEDIDTLVQVLRGADVQLQALPHLVRQQEQILAEGWFKDTAFPSFPQRDTQIQIHIAGARRSKL